MSLSILVTHNVTGLTPTWAYESSLQKSMRYKSHRKLPGKICINWILGKRLKNVPGRWSKLFLDSFVLKYVDVSVNEFITHAKNSFGLILIKKKNLLFSFLLHNKIKKPSPSAVSWRQSSAEMPFFCFHLYDYLHISSLPSCFSFGVCPAFVT